MVEYGRDFVYVFYPTIFILLILLMIKIEKNCYIKATALTYVLEKSFHCHQITIG